MKIYISYKQFYSKTVFASSYCKEILTKSQTQTLFCSQISIEHVQKLTHQQKVVGERLITDSHIRYHHRLVPAAYTSFEEN